MLLEILQKSLYRQMALYKNLTARKILLKESHGLVLLMFWNACNFISTNFLV